MNRTIRTPTSNSSRIIIVWFRFDSWRSIRSYPRINCTYTCCSNTLARSNWICLTYICSFSNISRCFGILFLLNLIGFEQDSSLLFLLHRLHHLLFFPLLAITTFSFVTFIIIVIMVFSFFFVIQSILPLKEIQWARLKRIIRRRSSGLQFILQPTRRTSIILFSSLFAFVFSIRRRCWTCFTLRMSSPKFCMLAPTIGLLRMRAYRCGHFIEFHWFLPQFRRVHKNHFATPKWNYVSFDVALWASTTTN